MIDLTLVKDLFEHPPLRLHEGGVHGLVVVIEVDPTTEALNGLAPFVSIPHDDSATLSVVLLEAHLHNSGLASDTELLVNFVLLINSQYKTLHPQALNLLGDTMAPLSGMVARSLY